MKLLTEDSHRIVIRHFRSGHSAAVILAHGFYNNKDTYLFRGIAADLSCALDVISFDFRGHGESSGLFSWTSHEPKDLRAVVAYARECGYPRIGVIGFSLGAAVALIEASENRTIQSVIAVSGPSDFWKIDYQFWKKDMLDDLKLNLGSKGKGKGIRPGNPFLPKIKPSDIVARISPTPVLFIHGSEDWLIRPWHSEALYQRAQEPRKLEIFKGMGHAERIYDVCPREFMKVCLGWFQETLQNKGGPS
jgi:pimeloyl-ACP methyl ester carboxylesterase